MGDGGTPPRRGQRLYDRWAAYAPVYRLVEAMTQGLRREAVQTLALEPGDTVVDLGCGPGGSFGLLAAAVAPAGTVVGVDYSAGMVQRARRNMSDESVVTVLRADAAALPGASGSIDGVFASLALSAIPEARAVLTEVARVLRPDGCLVVVDGRLPAGIAGRLLAPVYDRVANVQQPDVPSLLREAFPTMEIRREFDAGLGFIARAAPE